MKPLILCMGCDEGKQMRLSFLAASMGIRFQAVREKDQGKPLGVLCGLDASGPVDPGAVPGEMLVLAFLPEGMMDVLFAAMKKSGDAVALKAVLTPTNRYWSPVKLYRHIHMEAVAMGGKTR